MMKALKKIILLLAVLTILTGCEDQFEETIKFRENQDLQRGPYDYYEIISEKDSVFEDKESD